MHVYIAGDDRMNIMLHDECVSSTLPYVPFTRGLKVRLLLATLFVTWEVQHTNIHTFKPRGGNRYGEQKIAQFRTHYLTKESPYVSTQQSGQDTMDTKMI